ncbi:putative O-linked GlcNAc transferase-putative TPR-containing transmembrane protein [Acidisarcina polymorpha]|uniref:Putative O-linked GlcNAc transferase-putative TPR-containing transmembrane protein n=1 Tax=Acidisarcina polymorpha TaxID=2211140 RepID=A0A2Z5G106_9BACT|nr:glycosyltransferase family 39 protein [Acidisarcina polymorpha]AXC12841.1 putative O-linked GlcNAc transferase-putative TPR-containing transmembrane protein [Acidisarcina polymorpha]
MLSSRARHWIFVVLALACGAALRLWFIHAYPEVDGDPLIYGDIAKNWLQHGIYGLTTDHGIRPTLIRLPGYPAFLALCFTLFGMEHYHAVMFFQTAIDLGTCLLIAALVRRLWSRRAAMVALWLAALCPFTANYAATPLAETLSIFCVALGFYALVRLLENPYLRWLLLLSFSMSYATLLRPDGALLAVALCPAIVLCSLRRSSISRLATGRALKLAILAGILSVLPFVPWAARNWRTFHIFQPLAPRYAMDPGDFTYPGFNRWVKTWCVDLVSTSEVYWNGNSDKIDIGKLPSRAFDSPAQYQQTKQLLDDYNETTTLSPEIDVRFEELAQQRTQGHAIRSYLVLPLMRLADMWLRPRTELLWIEMRWWDHYHHPEESDFVFVYAALNLGYLVAAVAGFVRRPPLAAVMLAFVLLRCALLFTLEAPEPRYTLECFPVVIALAAIAFGGRRDVPASASV